MKRKISVIVALFALWVGTASAAGIWGSYKGNSIIRLLVNGSPVKISDVPAINYQGRTMIPIYLLHQAGIKYSWDQTSQTVNILTTNKEDSQVITSSKNDIYGIAQRFKSRNIDYISMVSDGNLLRSLTFYYKYGVFDENESTFNSLMNDVLKATLTTDANYFVFEDANGVRVKYYVSDIQAFFNGSLSSSQFNDRMMIEGLDTASSNTQNSGSSTANNTGNNAAICSSIVNLYKTMLNNELAELGSRGLYESSIATQARIQNEEKMKEELALKGCPA